MNTDMTKGLEALSDILELIDKVAQVEENLAENERGVFTELRQKYNAPCEIGYEDKILLEVMLRNITVRKDLGML